MADQSTTWAYIFKDQINPGLQKTAGNMNKVDSSFNKVEKSTNKGFKKISKGSDKMFKGISGNMTQLTNQVPVLGQIGPAIASPVGIASAAVLALGLTFNKAIDKASSFNNVFLETANLNLDKTTNQVNRLRDSVLDLSFGKGFDPEKTSTAFFDVQSATGLFGEQVEDTVSTVGEFARIMKADFNKQVAGAAKAIGIFGLQTEDLDGFLASSFKTVQVGVTTFDELAKVQTEFGGAAAAAGQNFDDSNKIFAAFTKTAKSVDIAANLTKTAFQDLGKAATVDAFKSIGVNLFDASGQMRQIDDVLEEVVPKFKTLSDQEFATFRDAVGGSEGIRELLNTAKVAGDDLLATFQQFDQTEFDFNKALENAGNDLSLINDQIDNKMNTAWIRLGDTVLPLWINIKKSISDTLDEAATKIGVAGNLFNKVFRPEAFQADITAATEADFAKSTGVAERLSALSGEQREEAVKGFESLQFKLAGQVGALRKQAEDEVGLVHDATLEQAAVIEGRLNAITSALKTPVQAGGLGADSLLAKDDATAKGIADLTKDTDKKVGAGIAGVAGGGKQVRNITVNIGKLNEEFIINTTTLPEAAPDVERQMTEVLVKAVRQAEVALSSD